ncbi:DUF748 domain-containing protein [Litoribacillus peritrichatus]|uniref:DUF748 domain-containing protein n=1 Tax=Litoribacillus peritrichatus TaxID=718191 RepID=A0ABP7ML64_9GAMM
MEARTSRSTFSFKSHPVLFSVLGFYVLYLFIAGLLLPHYLKSQIPQWVGQLPKLSAEVASVSFNPFLLRLTINDLRISEPASSQQTSSAQAEKQPLSQLAGFTQVTADLQLSSLFRQAAVLSEVIITEPYGRLTKDQQGAFLWQTWPDKAEQPDNAPASKPFPLIIEHLAITQGAFDFEDFSRKTPYQTTLGPIDLTLTNLSTLPEDEGNYQLNIAVKQGEETAEFSWKGLIALDPFYSEGRLTLESLSLNSVWDYIKDDVFFEIQQGKLSLGFDYQIQKDQQFELALQNGETEINNLIISEKGQSTPLITLNHQALTGLSFNLQDQALFIDELKHDGLNVVLNRNADGELELIRILSERPIQQATKKASERASGKSDWQVAINHTSLVGGQLTITDQTTTPAATFELSDLELQLTNASTDADQVSELMTSMITNQTGNLKINGELALLQQQGNLEIDLKSFPVASLQPYLNQETELSIDNVLFDVNGQIKLKKGGHAFHGSSQIRDIKLTNKVHKQAILAGDGIYLENIAFSESQKSLAIGEILLDQMLYPLTILARTDQGTRTNLSDLVKPPASGSLQDSTSQNGTSPASEAPITAPAEEHADNDWLVEVEKVSLRKNTVQFSDRGLPTPVYFNIESLNGSVDKLSSNNLSRADVTISGEVNGYAPFRAEGKINPLSEEAYTNLDVTMQDVAISTFSPYASHFLNYPLTQGKLSTELKYKLNNKDLVADNHVFIDQLELGKYTKSEAGLGLPIPLAVSLLQDNKGEIDINLPIKGNLNDPDFHYGSVVINAFVNILTKAITSPFTLLANIAGTDEDLSVLIFQPAQSALTPEETAKLASIAEAMNKRAALKLSITGQTLTQDTRQLQINAWQQQLSRDNIQADPASPEYAQYLAQQTSKPLPTSPEAFKRLEQTLIEAMSVQASTLTEIAHQRAINTRKQLIEAGIAEKRLFIREAKLNQSNDVLEGVTLEVK